MKKLCASLLMICLLFPTVVFASTESADILNEDEVQLFSRNQRLTEYLSNNLCDAAAYDESLRSSIVKNFFKENPQICSGNYYISDKFKKEPQIIETVDLYKNVDEQENSIEFYVTYYDDGSFVLGTLTGESQNGTIMPLSEGNKAGNNYHERWDQNVFVWRTFVTATFYYDNNNGRKMCNPVSYDGNQRVRDANVVYSKPYYGVSHPYNNSVCRVQRKQSFTEYPGGYSKGADDLRVSCNHLGQIMKN